MNSRFVIGVVLTTGIASASFAACSSESRPRASGDGGASGEGGGAGGGEALGGGGGGVGGAGGVGGEGGGAAASCLDGAMGMGGGSDVDCEGGGGLSGVCAPWVPGCNAIPSRCIALDDPCGKSSYTLRMAQLSITKPPVLSAGVVANIVSNAVILNMPGCNLPGGGTFSWIIHFDASTQLLSTGGAHPSVDPEGGYCMVNEVLSNYGNPMTVAPATVSALTCGDGRLVVPTIPELTLPIFLDMQGTNYVLVPMKNVQFHDTKLSPEHRCIGEYNADGLDPKNNCTAEPPNTLTFKNAGMFDSAIALEDADGVSIGMLHQSLCVLLSGDAVKYGDGGNPSRCARDEDGQIKFAGDWCTTTDQPATSDCHDAMRFRASFAASAVKMKDGC